MPRRGGPAHRPPGLRFRAGRGADLHHPRRSHARAAQGLIAAVVLLAAPAAQAAPRVLSFDSCSDQYVLALSPRASIVGLSTRADDDDSRYRELARGLPLRRVTLETALAARPQVVVRYWGGDPRLVRALELRGVTVLTLDEASDFDGVRSNIRKIARGLGQVSEGEALIAQMDARLARAAGAWRGRSAVYLTPGGLTTGPGTLIDAILRAAGMTNAETRPGFQVLSLEQIALKPPQQVVLGFFDTGQLSVAAWSLGRHRLVRDLVEHHAAASLPGSMLGCPDWTAAEAAALLAARAPR